MFDPRTEDTPPLPDLVGMLAARERVTCSTVQRAHAGVALSRMQERLEEARTARSVAEISAKMARLEEEHAAAEYAKAAILHALEAL